MASLQAHPICVRNSYLHHILLGRRHLFEGVTEQRQLTKDGLIDALLVLFDECNNEKSKRDLSVATFIEKCNNI